MTDFYDYWLKVGSWDSQQAAFIINARDPRVDGGKVNFRTSIEDNKRNNREAWQQDVFEDYYILETAVKADWEKYVDFNVDYYFLSNSPKEGSPTAFISLAIDKQIVIPPVLSKKWEKIVKAKNQVEKEPPISPKMVETLQPFIKIIDEFKDSKDFDNYDTKIQQNLIESWLENKGLTRDEERVLKGLITIHYGITTARK